jgi:uncharacterized membrane protein HdeD (DUF308 family)
MTKPWMPAVAGILDIVSGFLGLLAGIFLTLAPQFIGAISRMPRFGMHPQLPEAFYPGLGAALIVIGILSIIGGVYALRIKGWGMALTGSICATLCGRLLGVVALIFTVLSKPDFK